MTTLEPINRMAATQPRPVLDDLAGAGYGDVYRVGQGAGAGYTNDFAVERHWRDARLTKIFEGTSEIQLRIISDALLGRS